jgi:ribosomal protein S27E
MSIDDGLAKHLFIQHLITNIKCAVCQSHYAPEDILIIDHRGEYWFMAVTCGRCRTQAIIFALIRETEESELIELTPEEWQKFQGMPPIDADDVLDMHELLRDFDRDFISLLERSQALSE